jgi:hypothetical protein
MSHSENTFDKKKMRDDVGKNPFIAKTTYKLKDFIKDLDMRTFFANA